MADRCSTTGSARASTRSIEEQLKLYCLHRGIMVSPSAQAQMSGDLDRPLTLHEYATTGGVTLRLGDIYINAPFDDWYCDGSQAMLDADADGSLFAYFEGELLPCEALPLPGYLDRLTTRGSRSPGPQCRTPTESAFRR